MKRNYIITLLTVLIMLTPRSVVAEENRKQIETFNESIKLYCNNYSYYSLLLPKTINNNESTISVKGRLNSNQQVSIKTPKYLDLYNKSDSINFENIVNIKTNRNTFTGTELKEDYNNYNTCSLYLESETSDVSMPLEISLTEVIE